MSSVSSKHFIRPWWLLVTIVVLCGMSVFVWLEATHTTHVIKHGNTSKVTATTDKDTADNEAHGGKGTLPNDNYTPPADNSGISMDPSTSEDHVVVGTKLVGYSDGTCTLTVVQGSAITTQTADVIYAPEFSTCAGFSVPINAIGRGTWNITLKVSSGGKLTSKTVTYEVR